jgi:predicted Zn finger-like uncharacterized protein
MILTCPSCGTQYVVKDGAIPPGGRQVRCAACKHSWHENPEASSDAVPAVEEESAADPEAAGDNGSIAEATLIEPRSGPEAEERAFEEAAMEAGGTEPAPGDEAREPVVGAEPAETPQVSPASDWKGPPDPEAQDDQFSPFAHADEEAPRRRSPAMVILVIVLVVAALAAAFWFLAPGEMKARLGLAAVGTSPLALVTTHMDRQRLESGNELLTVTGRVINPTDKDQNIPPLQAQLKTRTGKIVYRWTIAPPARTLPPGGSASFNSAEVNVPAGGDELTITLGDQGA